MSLRIWFLGVIIPFILSIFLVAWIHPTIVKVAKLKDIVDKPGLRKLQKTAVPVLGGVAVYWGIIIGVGLISIVFNSFALFTSIIAITVMMYIGLEDDILGLSPVTRLIMEVLVIFFVLYMDKVSINSLHGLMGIGILPRYLAYSLTAIAGAGIINIINMIEGVDGMSSVFCIMACVFFGITFAFSYDGTMTVLAALAGGSLIPFFFHNVFGKESKMFIGDSGTMMFGMIMTIFCMNMIDDSSSVISHFPNLGVVAFCLSVLSIPIFDTLRVMTGRICKGISPFQADKSHLHHLFIEIGFSHPGTTLCVIFFDIINVICWLISYRLGYSPTIQFFVVVFVGLLNTTFFYYIVRRMDHHNFFYRLLKWCAIKSHMERNSAFTKMQKIIDSI